MRAVVVQLLLIVLVARNHGYRIPRERAFEPNVFDKCFEEIGCVSFTEKWFHEKLRPKNMEPLNRHTIRTEFLLIKNQNNSTKDLVYDVMGLKQPSITVSGFKPRSCSIFVIHDFTSNGYTGWIKHLVMVLSRRTDCNLISIDWEAGAEPPFEQAISNARVVALEAKAFIEILIKCFAQSPDNLHIIGHGVGAHIAGYIGKSIPGVQRITGLDPTGHHFAKMPPEVRLDPDDAKYVEVLHTDSFNHRSQGSMMNFGHADFFINNAAHQPGCDDSSHLPAFKDIGRDNLQEGKILPACSHKRSFKYYIQALDEDDCIFIGIRCDQYAGLMTGKCTSCGDGSGGACVAFGLEPACVNTRNNSYFLQTSDRKPFCLVSYSVNITLHQGSSAREAEGYFEIILVSDTEQVTNASNSINHPVVRKMSSGKSYSFVFYAPSPRIDLIKEARVKWIYKSKKICILCDKNIAIKDIMIQRMTVNPHKRSPINYICPMRKGSELRNNDFVQFHPCDHLYGPNYNKTRLQDHAPIEGGTAKAPAAAMAPTTTPKPTAHIPAICTGPAQTVHHDFKMINPNGDGATPLVESVTEVLVELTTETKSSSNPVAARQATVVALADEGGDVLFKLQAGSQPVHVRYQQKKRNQKWKRQTGVENGTDTTSTSTSTTSKNANNSTTAVTVTEATAALSSHSTTKEITCQAPTEAPTDKVPTAAVTVTEATAALSSHSTTKEITCQALTEQNYVNNTPAVSTNNSNNETATRKIETASTNSASTKLETTSTKVEATSTKSEATSTKLEATSTKLEGNSTKLEAASTKLESTSKKLETSTTLVDKTQVTRNVIHANTSVTFLSSTTSTPKRTVSSLTSPTPTQTKIANHTETTIKANKTSEKFKKTIATGSIIFRNINADINEKISIGTPPPANATSEYICVPLSCISIPTEPDGSPKKTCGPVDNGDIQSQEEIEAEQKALAAHFGDCMDDIYSSTTTTTDCVLDKKSIDSNNKKHP